VLTPYCVGVPSLFFFFFFLPLVDSTATAKRIGRQGTGGKMAVLYSERRRKMASWHARLHVAHAYVALVSVSSTVDEVQTRTSDWIFFHLVLRTCTLSIFVKENGPVYRRWLYMPVYPFFSFGSFANIFRPMIAYIKAGWTVLIQLPSGYVTIIFISLYLSVVSLFKFQPLSLAYNINLYLLQC
jgi:hypothetical protein